MTEGDIKVIAMPASTRAFKTDDRNTTSGKGIARTIKAGEPVAECEYYVARIDTGVPGTANTATDILVGINKIVPLVLQKLFVLLGDSFRKWGIRYGLIPQPSY